VNALAMGWNPARVPLIREAFGQFRYPLTNFEAGQIEVCGDASGLIDVGPRPGMQFRASEGWRGKVEAQIGSGVEPMMRANR